METTTPHRLVDGLSQRISSLEIAFHHAYWESQVDASPETERRRADLELELRRVKGDPAAFLAVETALADEIHEPLLKRQLEVLQLSLKSNQMAEDRRAELVALSSAVETDFASYRPQLDDRTVSENEIEQILKTSDDEDLRRKAWAASKEIGGIVSGRVRELARLRNVAAHDLGYSDYYGMALELQELSEEWLFGILDDLEEGTRNPFELWKSALDDRLCARFGVSELYPWHYADPFFQQLPPDGRVSLDGALEHTSCAELAAKTFASWGMNIAGVLESSDLYPRAGKCQHAFCIDMDRTGKDVRILANVVPGERWTEVMLHESGHAAYDIGLNSRLPYLLRRPAHTFVTEAIALVSGRLVRDPCWLTDIAGVPAAEVGRIEGDMRISSAAALLVFARWGLVVVHFERAMYADPESDLDSLWWELVERFQGITRPPDRAASDWAAKIHVAAAPAYYQNYLLGEMFASQLRQTCERATDGFAGVEAAGRLLAERVFDAGASQSWDQIVEAATGTSLGSEAFAADSAL